MALSAGRRFGPYTVSALLGKGGMGEVYRAHDERLGRDVAIKVLPPSMSADAAALARFEREARAVAALNHPAIVALHDVGTQDGVAYVVTELLEGETLRERLDREGPIPPRRLLAIAAQVARGLGAAHARGIVHRDVKPENLFLLGDGRVKVLDFGIARQVPGDPALHDTVMATQPGIIMGTFGYLAPEVIRGDPATPQSDIFAFGLVLYEALTGSNPFRRETVAETLSAVLRDEPPPLGQAVPTLRPAAARLVHWCLEARPEDRPESLRDLAHHLDHLESEASVGAGHESSSDPGAARTDTLRLRRWVLTAVSLSLAALTLATYAYLSLTREGTASASEGGNLERVRRVVARAQQVRLDQLQLAARLVASFPDLKALLGTNAPTIREFLQEYQRSTGAPLLVAMDVDGRVLAATDESALPLGTAADGLARLVGAPGGSLIAIGGRPYHAASAAAEAGGTIFGVVIAAAPVDDEFARDLRDATEDETVLLDDEAVRGTTLRATAVPWTTRAAWRADGGSPEAARAVELGTQQFLAREVLLSPDGPLSAVVLRERATPASTTQGLRQALLGMAAVLWLVGASLSWWLPGVLARNGQRS